VTKKSLFCLVLTWIFVTSCERGPIHVTRVLYTLYLFPENIQYHNCIFVVLVCTSFYATYLLEANLTLSRLSANLLSSQC